MRHCRNWVKANITTPISLDWRLKPTLAVPIGSVKAVQNFGATDIIEITLDPAPQKGLKAIMVPMTKAAVIEWDSARLVISEDFADQ